MISPSFSLPFLDLAKCSGMKQQLRHILQMVITSAMMDGVTGKRYDLCTNFFCLRYVKIILLLALNACSMGHNEFSQILLNFLQMILVCVTCMMRFVCHDFLKGHKRWKPND